MGKKNVVGSYVVDITPVSIEGDYTLELRVGKKYEVHYGINQGIYVYKGVTIFNKDFPDLDCSKCHLFERVGDKSLFGFHGQTSPYQFTRIVKPL